MLSSSRLPSADAKTRSANAVTASGSAPGSLPLVCCSDVIVGSFHSAAAGRSGFDEQARGVLQVLAHGVAAASGQLIEQRAVLGDQAVERVVRTHVQEEQQQLTA